MMSRRRAVTAIACVLSAASLVAGCSHDSVPAPPAAPPVAPSPQQQQFESAHAQAAAADAQKQAAAGAQPGHH